MKNNKMHQESQLFWYKDAIIYQLHVKAFYDSNGDGIGDFRGLIDKLDYLADLGVTTLWLLPFYPSPLRDDGYDISDYLKINSLYGNMNDFRVFLQEAHARGIRLITDLVLNHTSDQHPWFQRARTSPPGSRWRNYYVWSDTTDKFNGARVIFNDFASSNWTWDSVAQAYYWHRFYPHQPDLNYDSPDVRREILKTVDFWLRLGVDGFRLDAVGYLYEREGTSCDNLPETHAFLKYLRKYIDEKYPDRMLLAEVNQWPENVIPYFNEGNECHMVYHFPIMPRLFMSLGMEDSFPLIEIIRRTPPIPDTCQWAIFLRNHDELTLEMVTDEDRDYMYRMYAKDSRARINLGIRRRLAPLLGDNRRRIELMNGLLFSLPGSPIIYYGDEIGMGDNIYLGDRDGVRTPMQWSADRNAGFSWTSSQRLYLPVVADAEYHYAAVNVESQQNEPSSLLWWMRRLIALRKRYKAFGRGTMEFIESDNRKVLAFVRHYENETILVVANLSRFVTYAQLDLTNYQGLVPVEMIGRTPFPAINEELYFVSLGPHTFFWFTLEEPRSLQLRPLCTGSVELSPVITVKDWGDLFGRALQHELTEAFSAYLNACSWFGGKGQTIKAVTAREFIPLPDTSAQMVFISVEYLEGSPEVYLLNLALKAADELGGRPAVCRVILRVRKEEEERLLYEVSDDKKFHQTMWAVIDKRRKLKGQAGEMVSKHSKYFRVLVKENRTIPDSQTLANEHNNSSILFKPLFVLKIFRKIETGINPDLEILRHFSEIGFGYAPKVHGSMEYFNDRNEVTTIAVLQQFVPHRGTAWDCVLDHLGDFYERILSSRQPPLLPVPFWAAVEKAIPDDVSQMTGAYLESLVQLGLRTGEMHIALAGGGDQLEFTPEPFNDFHRQALYHGVAQELSGVKWLLKKQMPSLEQEDQLLAAKILEYEQEVMRRIENMKVMEFNAARIRCHGDYRLEQLLYTGHDYMIIDFEGNPERPLSERRLKRSPLLDVASMLHSLYCASQAIHLGIVPGIEVSTENQELLQRWSQSWYNWAAASFLRGYVNSVKDTGLLPVDRQQLEVLLDVFLLQRGLYQVVAELKNRPTWIGIALSGLLWSIEFDKPRLPV
ncbi:maltose alpha-D-glucosyltransferase [Sporomusa termitida]|uniref:Maltokinase n=1 Tax=Sporomusa termitida TaxID=2377 RepID=A0A517DQN5_9FIRM|nr:maltose alpha-D-glucosyltransferase [Sporomusa termitida]QDR79637.1 1,4-alpha-glucan branching enzyme GlgB [Sporomusa termitida]